VKHNTKETEDQADELRRIFVELENSVEPMEPNAREETEDHYKGDEMDLLNLPPRKEVHDQNLKRPKLKMSMSLFRLTIVVIFLFCILAGVYFIWQDEIMLFFTS
jgi:hypothetical protein